MESYIAILAIAQAIFLFSPKLSKIYRQLVGGALILPNPSSIKWKVAESEVASWLLVHLISFGTPVLIFAISLKLNLEHLLTGLSYAYIGISMGAFTILAGLIVKGRYKKNRFLRVILTDLYNYRKLGFVIATCRLACMFLLFLMMIVQA